MVDINTQDFLDEIRFDIKENDLIKARAVFSFFGDVDEKTQKQALSELQKTDDAFAVPLFVGILANTPDLTKSFETLKEALFSRLLRNSQVLLSLLEKEEKAWDRAFLVKIAGEIRLEEAVPALLQILNSETDDKTIKSTIDTLGLLGDPITCSPVSEYLYTDNMELIMAAIRTLGQLGTPTAVQRLAEKIGSDTDLDLMVLDVLADIQSPEALEKLNDVLGSHYVHIRTTAKQKLLEIGPKAVPFLIRNLLHDDPDLLIPSLNVLGDIGDKAAITSIRNLIHNEPKDPNVRFAAYETLGRLPMQKGAYILAAGLEDPVANVRSAAAKAIDKNFDLALAAGMKNLTMSGDSGAMEIIFTIINSQCGNIFLGLIKEDFFIEPVFKYLADKAHPDIRLYFTKLLVENGYHDLSQQLTGEKGVKADTRLKVFAVDDSKMILNIYKSMLHNLGYEPEVFEFPAKALEQVQREKPHLIFTDLNMPDITGIEFSKGVRRLYNKEDLPIIMVTTQNEAQDNQAAYSAGVNNILYKPFSEDDIGKALSDLKIGE